MSAETDSKPLRGFLDEAHAHEAPARRTETAEGGWCSIDAGGLAGHSQCMSRHVFFYVLNCSPRTCPCPVQRSKPRLPTGYDALADSSASSTAFPPVVKIFATFSWPCFSMSVGSVRLGSPSTKRLYSTTTPSVSPFC